jgi:hypothetical protein
MAPGDRSVPPAKRGRSKKRLLRSVQPQTRAGFACASERSNGLFLLDSFPGEALSPQLGSLVAQCLLGFAVFPHRDRRFGLLLCKVFGTRLGTSALLCGRQLMKRALTKLAFLQARLLNQVAGESRYHVCQTHAA